MKTGRPREATSVAGRIRATAGTRKSVLIRGRDALNLSGHLAALRGQGYQVHQRKAQQGYWVWVEGRMA